MGEGIIDLARYRRDRDGETGDGASQGAFALWGGEDERSRFALPLWRAIYLAGGGRGGVVRTRAGRPPDPHVVLDLEQDPPRIEFDAALVRSDAETAPALEEPYGGHALTVFLGEDDGVRWFLCVTDRADGLTLAARDREDILFLAGECAGLLFLRKLSRP